MLSFAESLRGRAPESARDYASYYERYRGILEELRLEALPCNSWVLKLASHWLNYLQYTGRIGLETYARKRIELEVRRRACLGSRGLQALGRGLGRCPDSCIRPDARTQWFYVAKALIESGVRLKHLWRASRMSVRPEVYGGGVVVLDLRARYGFKRVNVAIMDYYSWLRASRVLSRVDYRSVGKAFARRGWTPPGCYRKYHWNICIAATGDRDLCRFIQGRREPVDIAYYEDYKASGVAAYLRMRPYLLRILEGEPLSAVLASLRLEYKAPPRGVEDHEHPIVGPEPEGLSELLGDSDSQAEPIATLIRKYSNLLNQ